ncbi:MAG: TRAP transporter large permease [Clostridia bacterium]|jgi:tripartite ATP-independent transporter DctM subunit|nr:TRAP transporter large permease [Clostridia bacterium]MDH7573530.1 TRAP transporter large permease [Clostridia bacterium]
MSPVGVGITGFLILLALILLFRFPIGFALILVGFAGIAVLTSLETALGMLGHQVLANAASYDMAMVAMFVFMGELAGTMGMSERAFASAYRLLGRVRGGLAIASIAACGAFAAVCGSSPATAATIGGIAIPEMKKYGYKDDFICGTVAAGGLLGILIPPSMGFILFGLLTEQSIAKLYVAGILPGLLLMGFFVLVCFLVARSGGGAERSATPVLTGAREKLASVTGLTDILVVFLLVIGGLTLGFFSPTEAGAAGVLGIVVVAMVRRVFTWKRLWVAMLRATATTGMIVIIFIGAMLFTNFLAASMLPFSLSEFFANLSVSPLLVMAGILLLWIVLGCAMDSIAMIMLTVPVLYPIVAALGLDPIWFAVLGVMSIEAGLITPPDGMNLYIVARIAKVPLHVVFRGVIPFILAVVVAMVLVLLFPQIALVLPKLL